MLNFLRPVRFYVIPVTLLTATGGITLAGTATISITALPLAVTGTGGITLGGTATATALTISQVTGSGGITLGGTATATALTISQVTATGGITLGGTATVTALTISQVTATGGITLGGTATAVVVTPFSNVSSLLLDGTDDYVTTTFDTLGLNTSGFTVSAWVKKDNFGTLSDTSDTIIGRYTGTTDRFSFEFGAGAAGTRMKIQVGPNYLLVDPHGLSVDVWHHFLVVYDPDVGTYGTYKLYLNNVLKGTKALTSAWSESATRIYSTIGANKFASFHLYDFDGNIDELAIWDTALSTSNITALYNSGDGPIDATTITDLIAYWRMGDGTEGGSGSTVYDMSTNSHNGTLVNGASFASDVP